MSGERTKKHDVRQQITDQIIESLEKGVIPWHKPWNATDKVFHFRPCNPVSGTKYRGGNRLLLGMLHGDDPRWVTFKQAQSQGWKVKNGAKATWLEHWVTHKEFKETDEKTGEERKVRVQLENPYPAPFAVFHASQVEGIPPQERPDANDSPTWNPVERAENILASSGAKIRHIPGSKAYYAPRQDEICLPLREQFNDEKAYYGVALHELAHWTGHPDRLNRDLRGSFGTEDYAKEELRAEIASAFLEADTGISRGEADRDQHAGYIQSWLKALREDKNEIFRAAKDAEHIADYVVELEQTREKSREKNAANQREVENPELAASPGDSGAVTRADEDRALSAAAYLESVEHAGDRTTMEGKELDIEEQQYARNADRVTGVRATIEARKTTETAEASKEKEHMASLRKECGLLKLAPARPGGRYKGQILKISADEQYAIQQVGWKSGVLHRLKELDCLPRPGEPAIIEYDKTHVRGTVAQGPEVEKRVAKHREMEQSR